MSDRRQKARRLAWAVLALPALVLLPACEEEQASQPSGSVGSGPVIAAVVAAPAQFAAGDSATIAVQIVASQTSAEPVANVTVRFGEVGRTLLGSFNPAEATTDELGWAYTTYRPPAAERGQIDLKASVEDDIDYFSLYVSDALPAQGQMSVTLDAVEQTLPADGASTLALTISVTSEGAPAGGRSVRLVAGEAFVDNDLDGIFGPGDELTGDADGDSLWDAIGSIGSPVTTGADGTAHATYTAGLVEGAVTIKATVDSVACDYVIVLQVERAQIAVTTDPLETWADGISQAAVIAQVTDSEGAPLGGKLVRFTAGEAFSDSDGDGYYTPGTDPFTDDNENGVWDVNGTITSAVTSGSNGQASAVYTASRQPGTVVLYASTRDGGTTATLRLLALPRVDHAAGSWAPTWVHANGTSEATLALQIFDVNGSPIAGKEITLQTTLGTISSAAISDAEGRLTAVLTAGTTEGLAQVTASSGTWSADFPLSIVALPAVGAIALSADESEIWPRGTGSDDRTTLRAVCTTAGGESAPEGIAVTFTLIDGPGGGAGLGATAETMVTVLTDAQGAATTELQAGTLSGWVQVTAASGVASGEVAVEIRSLGPVQQVDFIAQPSELYVLGVGETDHAVLRASCSLAPGVPAPLGTPVTFALLAEPGGDPAATLVDGGMTIDLFTDEWGVAEAVLRSGTHSGPVTVQATAGGISQTLHLGVSAGPPAGMTCWADTTSLGYSEQTGLQAAVYDAYHNPVPNGTVVTFTANTGLAFTSSGTGSDGTAQGVAEATYLAPAQAPGLPEIATVEARIDDGAGQPLSCTIDIDLPVPVLPVEPGDIARLEMLLSVPEIAVRETGGQELCQITVTCFDENNLPVGHDREVEFEIAAGPDGGETLQDAGWGPVTVLTDAGSRAVMTLGSGTISGTIEVIARGGNSASQSALVSVAAGPPAYVSVGIDPLNIRGWDIVGANADVVAYVSDIYNNPVRDGSVVYFTCDEGIIRGNYLNTGSLGSSTTEGGVGIGTYFSGQPRIDGRVLVTATTAGGSVIGTCGLISSGPPTSVAFFSPAPPVSLLADGDSEVDLWVEVLDVNDNYVVAGTIVEFRTPLGVIDDNAQTSDGVYGSVARGTLRSEALGQDYSWSVPDDGIGAVVSVSAAAGLAGAAGDAMEVNFLTGSAYRHNSRIEVETTVETGTTVPFEVLVADRYGNPLGGHVLAISATGGATVTAAGTTDSWGSAYPLYFTAPASDTTCVITVVDTDPGYGGMTLSAKVTVN